MTGRRRRWIMWGTNLPLTIILGKVKDMERVHSYLFWIHLLCMCEFMSRGRGGAYATASSDIKHLKSKSSTAWLNGRVWIQASNTIQVLPSKNWWIHFTLHTNPTFGYIRSRLGQGKRHSVFWRIVVFDGFNDFFLAYQGWSWDLGWMTNIDKEFGIFEPAM